MGNVNGQQSRRSRQVDCDAHGAVRRRLTHVTESAMGRASALKPRTTVPCALQPDESLAIRTIRVNPRTHAYVHSRSISMETGARNAPSRFIYHTAVHSGEDRAALIRFTERATAAPTPPLAADMQGRARTYDGAKGVAAGNEAASN
ncbi:hypothetical protein MRX96_030195 [Rhipicephalus microplus]